MAVLHPMVARLRNVNLARLSRLIELFFRRQLAAMAPASNSGHGRPDGVLPLGAARLACILILATTLRQRTKSSGRRPAQRENHLSLITAQPHFAAR
jgi:hypothetical protein